MKMNSIAGFRFCNLSNEDLIKEIDRQCDEMFRTQKVPTRHIPARPDNDFDLLLGELLLRFKGKISIDPMAVVCIIKTKNNATIVTPNKNFTVTKEEAKHIKKEVAEYLDKNTGR